MKKFKVKLKFCHLRPISNKAEKKSSLQTLKGVFNEQKQKGLKGVDPIKPQFFNQIQNNHIQS
ncbi:MAG: hypothetical protein HY280_09825 [Nitrospinae bacterium]|nr:hypothetical protein [Nitrospinota bacterium]